MLRKEYPPLAFLGRIGVLTTSGKAYLALTSELSRKGIEYVPLTPNQTIPLDVRVVIATEGSTIEGRRVVTFQEDVDPRRAVEEALLFLLGKTKFKELILGIDPGKQIGLAVLGDGIILETGSYTNIDGLVDEMARVLSAFPSERSVVRIGTGAEEYSSVLRSALASRLPIVLIQLVEESGTTNGNTLPEKEGISRNIASAIRIALRRGD